MLLTGGTAVLEKFIFVVVVPVRTPFLWGVGVTTPPLLVAGRATCLCITDAPQVWPARSLLGTPGSATIRAPPTDFMGDSERERDRVETLLPTARLAQ